MSDEENEHWGEVEEGIDLLEAGELDAAIDALLRVSRQNPTNEYAFYFLGAAYFELERWDEALAAYVRALELRSGYLGAMIGAGQTLRRMGRHEHALRMGRQILNVDEHDPDGLYLMGTVYFQRGEGAAARQYLERFLQTGPEIEVAIEVEGMLQVLRGEIENA